MKMKHEISVFERVVTITQNPTIVQNGVQSDYISIILDNEWSDTDIDRILVVFSNNDTHVRVPVTRANLGNVLVPWEVLQKNGKLYISIVGKSNEDDIRIITERMVEPFRVSVSGTAEDGSLDPIEPSPDEIRLILNKIDNLVADMADHITTKKLNVTTDATITLIKNYTGNYVASTDGNGNIVFGSRGNGSTGTKVLGEDVAVNSDSDIALNADNDIDLTAGSIVRINSDNGSGGVATIKMEDGDIDLTASTIDVTAGMFAYKNYEVATKNDLATLVGPMHFKGTLGTGGTITSLPTASAANEGFTYEVITDGTYAGKQAEVGDMFISNGSEWVLIPSGDEPAGTVTSEEAIQTNSTVAREKTVPTGACEYAIIDAIGGMSRKGKNLLNPTLATTTQNGVTCTKNADGTYTLNGTATANTAFDFPQMTLDVANKKLLGCPSGGSSTTYFMAITDGIIPSSDYGEGVIISNATKSSCYVRILIRSGVTANNLVFKPMITTGTSLTYADYEPYTDSLIDSPVDKVVSVGANVLPFPTDYEQKTINGITFTRQGGVVTLKGTATSTAVYRVNLIKGFNIPISIGQGGNGCLYLNNSFMGNTYIQFCNADTVIDGWGINVINRKHSTYSSMGGKYADNILVVVNTGQTYGEGVTFKLMFSDNGSTNAEFMPYYSSTNTIPTAVINKCPDYGIGISADVCNYIDFKARKYHKRVGKVDMGSLNWTRRNVNYCEATLTTAKPPASNSTKFNGLCAKYDISTYSNSAKPSVAMSINSVIAVTDATYNDSTVEQFKTAMNGVYLYYELAEEEIIDLSDVWVDGIETIEAEAGGTVSFHYPDYDTYTVDMPNTVHYLVDPTDTKDRDIKWLEEDGETLYPVTTSEAVLHDGKPLDSVLNTMPDIGKYLGSFDIPFSTGDEDAVKAGMAALHSAMKQCQCVILDFDAFHGSILVTKGDHWCAQDATTKGMLGVRLDDNSLILHASQGTDQCFYKASNNGYVDFGFAESYDKDATVKAYKLF